MTGTALTLEVARPTVALTRAIAVLRRSTELDVHVRRAGAPDQAPGFHTLRVERGSLIAPVLTLLRAGAEAPDQDVALALNPAVWFDHDLEPWQRLGRPLPQRAALGSPDPERPWVLVDGGESLDVQAVAAATELEQPQLHVLGRVPAPRGCVSWLPTPGIVASLLGRVQAVVTPPGALAWDAARAGVPVYPPLPAAGDLRALARQRLAATLPALLASDPDFLVALLTSLLEQSEPGPFGTAAWLRQAYATPRGSPPEARWRRKLLKLRRDPLAFWADSWLGRRARGTRAGP